MKRILGYFIAQHLLHSDIHQHSRSLIGPVFLNL